MIARLLATITLTATLTATATTTHAAPAAAQLSDQGGGIYGWRCRNDGNGNTLWAIGWLANRTNRVGCETDVQMDAQGHWWVWHDEHLCEARQDTLPEGMARCGTKLGDLSTEQASGIRYWKGRELPIASARRFFTRAEAKAVPLMVEVKRYPSGTTQTDIDRLVAIAVDTGVDARWEVFGGRTVHAADGYGGYVIRQLRDAGAARVGAKSTPADPAQLAALGATFYSTRPVTVARVAEYAAYGIALREKMAQPRKWAGIRAATGGDRFITNKPVRAWRTRKQR